MKKIVELIIKSLVDKTDEVNIVQSNETENTIKIGITVAKNEVGKVIGKKGNVIKAIRTILKSVGADEGKKIVLDILE